MSITSDIRGYADSAVTQGKQALSSAQANANDIAQTANGAVNDLRASAEKAINLDALRTAVEPYLAQVKEVGDSVTDRAEELLNTLKSDPRVAKLVGTANSLTGVVLERVQSLTGLGSKPAASKPAPKPAAKATRKPAATKPATAKPATATTAKPATKSTARKTTAKASPDA